jgi:hypothetical protein
MAKLELGNAIIEQRIWLYKGKKDDDDDIFEGRFNKFKRAVEKHGIIKIKKDKAVVHPIVAWVRYPFGENSSAIRIMREAAHKLKIKLSKKRN